MSILSTLEVPIKTKVICFCWLRKCLEASWSSSAGAVSGSTLFASTLTLVSNISKLYATDDFGRQQCRMEFLQAL